MALRKDSISMAFLLAAMVAIAMVSPSCHAVEEECNPIIPCLQNTCFVYCKQLGYDNPQVHCERKHGSVSAEICCCGWVGKKKVNTPRPLLQ